MPPGIMLTAMLPITIGQIEAGPGGHHQRRELAAGHHQRRLGGQRHRGQRLVVVLQPYGHAGAGLQVELVGHRGRPAPAPGRSSRSRFCSVTMAIWRRNQTSVSAQVDCGSPCVDHGVGVGQHRAQPGLQVVLHVGEQVLYAVGEQLLPGGGGVGEGGRLGLGLVEAGDDLLALRRGGDHRPARRRTPAPAVGHELDLAGGRPGGVAAADGEHVAGQERRPAPRSRTPRSGRGRGRRGAAGTTTPG